MLFKLIVSFKESKHCFVHTSGVQTELKRQKIIIRFIPLPLLLRIYIYVNFNPLAINPCSLYPLFRDGELLVHWCSRDKLSHFHHNFKIIEESHIVQNIIFYLRVFFFLIYKHVVIHIVLATYVLQKGMEPIGKRSLDMDFSNVGLRVV